MPQNEWHIQAVSRSLLFFLLSLCCTFPIYNFSSGAVCDYMSLCTCTCKVGMYHLAWIICIESSFNFQNHPFTNMLLTGHTLIDKIDHFCTFLSVLIKANWTLFPVSHTYIWSIAQWAIQRQCVKKISAVQKRIEEKKWELKGKNYLWRRIHLLFFLSCSTTISHVYIDITSATHFRAYLWK